MRKRKYGTILLSLCLVASVWTGCGGEKSREESSRSEGIMNFGYLYEEDGIYLTTVGDRMMSSSWDDVNFEYICEDLTCDHQGESCSAKLVDHGEGTVPLGFCVKYQDKLIIFDSYAEDKSPDGVETDVDFYAMDFRYQTDVYEANLDGTNRVKNLKTPR
jgi:hypothetical protein